MIVRRNNSVQFCKAVTKQAPDFYQSCQDFTYQSIRDFDYVAISQIET